MFVTLPAHRQVKANEDQRRSKVKMLKEMGVCALCVREGHGVQRMRLEEEVQ